MRNHSCLVIGAVVLVASGCFHALPPDRPLARPVDYKGYAYTFPSGLRIINYENPSATEFMLDVSYGIGGRDEDPKQLGIAHLAEHMAFKGRQHGATAPQIWERLLASGVTFNAVTTSDSTDYFEVGKPDQFNAMAALESERMRDPLAQVSLSDFEAERDVVINEYRQRNETEPTAMQLQWLLETALPGSVYSRSVGGSVASLRSLTLEDVRAWYRAHYRPENAIIVVRGPKSSPEVLRFVEAAFGRLAKGTPGAARVPPSVRAFPAPPPPLSAEQPLVVKEAPVERPRLWMAWPVPGAASPELPKGYVAASVLGSFLQRRFGDDSRVDSVAVFPMMLDGVGLIVAVADLHDSKDAPAIAELIDDHLIDFVAQGGSAALMTLRARSALLTDHFLSLEQLDAQRAAQYWRTTGKPDFIGGWEQQIRDQLANDVGDFGYRYLTRAQSRRLVVTPAKAVAAQQDAPVAVAAPVESFADLHEDAPFTATPSDVEAMAGKPRLDRVTQRTLPGGLRVVVASRGTLPVVEVRLVVPMAPADGKTTPVPLPSIALATSLTTQEMNGTHGDAVGALPSRRLGLESFVVGASAPSGNLPHLLADLGDWLDSPGVDEGIFKSMTRALAAREEASEERPHDRGAALLYPTAFPGHPYGARRTAAAIRALSAADAERWLQSVLQPGQATLLIVGDVQESPELWAEIERRLGGWKSARAPAGAAVPVPGPLAGRRVVVVDRPNASQSELAVLVRGPRADAQGDAALEALAWYTAQHLTQFLRAKEGVTYGVHAQHRRLDQAELLEVQTAVETRATAHAVDLLVQQLAALRDRPLADGVVAQARWHLSRTYAMRFDTIGTAADALEETALHGYARDYWESYPRLLGALAPDGLQVAAQKLSIGAESVVIVGDRAVIQPQLEKAGYVVELAK